jgi:hypothetical protein
VLRAALRCALTTLMALSCASVFVGRLVSQSQTYLGVSERNPTGAPEIRHAGRVLSFTLIH